VYYEFNDITYVTRRHYDRWSLQHLHICVFVFVCMLELLSEEVVFCTVVTACITVLVHKCVWKKVLDVSGQNCSLCARKVTCCKMRSRVTCIITGCALYYFTKSIFLQDTRFPQQWFWEFWSSGILHCVAELIVPNISDVHGALVSEVCSLLLGLHNLAEGIMVLQDDTVCWPCYTV
jgi:hypothetical protein